MFDDGTCTRSLYGALMDGTRCYVDDFYSLTYPIERGNAQFAVLNNHCKELALRVGDATKPGFDTKLMGFQWMMIDKWLHISGHKRVEMIRALRDIIHNKFVTQKKMEKLLGRLDHNHIA